MALSGVMPVSGDMPLFGCPPSCPRSTRWSPARSSSVSPWWMRPLGDRSGFSPPNKSATSLGLCVLVVFLLSACSHGGCWKVGGRSGWGAAVRVRGSSDPSFRRGWLLSPTRRVCSSLWAVTSVMGKQWRFGGLVAADEEKKLGPSSPSTSTTVCWYVACTGGIRLLSQGLGLDCNEISLEQEEDVVLTQFQSWTSSLRQLQHLPEASFGRYLISSAGYEIFASFLKLEVMKSALWSIQYNSVGGRPRALIINTIFEAWFAELELHKHNFQMTLMQVACGAKHMMEQDVSSMFKSTWFLWYDDKHGEDAVPVVRVDPSVVDDNTPVAVPQIQRRGPLSLSSVMDIQYLQLSTPLPQVQTPDRPSGEPPAGHQLVWSTEALEDCICGTFGSELSTDGRSPCGSICSLLRLRNVLLFFLVVRSSFLVPCSVHSSSDVL